MHATKEEAQARTEQVLNLYADFCEQGLAIPVVCGQKVDKEKLVGAVVTCMIESLIHDSKALWGGTSYNFGDGFARILGMQLQDKGNSLKYTYQISWGMTARMIDALIMVHSDDSGLEMPLHIVPVQVTIASVVMHKEGVPERVKALAAELKATGVCVNVDNMDHRPGFKFVECKMCGVPLRTEPGPRDIEVGNCVLVRRNNGEESEAAPRGITATVSGMLETTRKAIFEKAKQHRDTHTYNVTTMEEFTETVKNRPGFVRVMWCGDQACEDRIEEETGAASRCVPLTQEKLTDRCVCCEKSTKKMVYQGAVC